MALKRHCHHHHHHRSSLSFATITAITFLLLSTVSALRLSPPPQPQPQVSNAMKEQIKQGGGGRGGGEIMKGILSRRRLSGPGSSPPTCRSKCGRCAPCKPVHVPIQPGLSIPLEYYPEAWRCKCGNKLFMP